MPRKSLQQLAENRAAADAAELEYVDENSQAVETPTDDLYTPVNKPAPKTKATKAAPAAKTTPKAKSKEDKPAAKSKATKAKEEPIKAKDVVVITRADLAERQLSLDELNNDETFSLSSTGLVVREGHEVTFDNWRNYGVKLNRTGQAISWAWIDWLLEGRKLGDEYAQYADLTGMSSQSVANLLSTMSKYTRDQRVDGVSISAHQEVAYMEPRLRDQLLRKMRDGYIESNADLRRVKQFMFNGLSVEDAILALTVPPTRPSLPQGNGSTPTTPATPTNVNSTTAAANQALAGLDLDHEDVVDGDAAIAEAKAANTISSAEYVEIGSMDVVHDGDGVLFPAEAAPGELPANVQEWLKKGLFDGHTPDETVLRVVIYRKVGK